jgi:hypothetical protein
LLQKFAAEAAKMKINKINPDNEPSNNINDSLREYSQIIQN